MIQQTTEEGSHRVVEQTQYNDANYPIKREVYTNGEPTLVETLTYDGGKVSRRCENGVCIDYTYKSQGTKVIERSFYKGMQFEETVFEDSFPISKTIRGITKNTSNYSVEKIPGSLQSWFAVCPENTKMFSFIDQPQEAICTTKQVDFP